MSKRLTVYTTACLLVAGSAWAQGIYLFEAENADTLGTNYVAVADTNVPPLAYNSSYITGQYNRTTQPSEFDKEAAVYSIPALPTNTTWDLYLRIHVGPGNYNDDSLYLATSPLGGFWDDIITNEWAGDDFGFNGLAGLTGLDGAATTSEGYHWVKAPVTYWVDPLALYLQWACAPREDGLELDAFALAWTGLPVTEEMLDPANAGVELFAGGYEPTLPVSTPTPAVLVQFVDGAGTVDTNNITVTVNGGSVTNFTVEYADFLSTVSFVPAPPLSVPSTNAVQVVAASLPGGMLVTNSFSIIVEGNPIAYVAVTTNNTVMATSTNGPVGAGTALITATNHVADDGLWRFRDEFGIPVTVTNEPTFSDYQAYSGLGNVYESQDDNCPRLRTSAYVHEPGMYRVYAYFNGNEGWDLRAGLEDTPGTDSLALFNSGNATMLFSYDGGFFVHEFYRTLLGTVFIADTGTPVTVYQEDAPTVGGRTWVHGIGLQRVGEFTSGPTYVDATTNNTIMAVSTDGPVGAGTALVVNTTQTQDGIWRFRSTFGVPSSVTNEPSGEVAPLGGVLESTGWDDGAVDNCPRLKTSVSSLPLNSYDVYGYFWRDETGAPWTIRLGLEDTPGTDTLIQYDVGNSVEVAHDNAPNGGRRLLRAYLGRVYDVTSIDVFVEDRPATNGNTRTWYDGIGYEVAQGATFDPEIDSISVSGGNATLTWTSETLGTYSIAHKTNLTDAVWTPVKTGIAGGDPTTTDSVPVSGASFEFFRIQGD